jgi:hypothetical protein
VTPLTHERRQQFFQLFGISTVRKWLVTFLDSSPAKIPTICIYELINRSKPPKEAKLWQILHRIRGFHFVPPHIQILHKEQLLARDS